MTKVKTESPDDPRLREVSRTMQHALESTLEILDRAEFWTELQTAFRQMVAILGRMEPRSRDHALVILNKYLELSLLHEGFRRDEVDRLTKHLVKNWHEIIERDAQVDIHAVYEKMSQTWARLNEESSSKLAKSTKSAGWHLRQRIGAIGRLVTGAAALVFDVSKTLSISPVPMMVTATMMGGAVLFWQGVDGVLEEKDD